MSQLINVEASRLRLVSNGSLVGFCTLVISAGDQTIAKIPNVAIRQGRGSFFFSVPAEKRTDRDGKEILKDNKPIYDPHIYLCGDTVRLATNAVITAVKAAQGEKETIEVPAK